MIDAQVETKVEEVEAQPTPVEFKVSWILQDLEDGLDRKAIQKKYSLTADGVKHLFQHPTLRGKRPKRAKKSIGFTIVDDTVDRVADNTAENDSEYTNFEIID